MFKKYKDTIIKTIIIFSLSVLFIGIAKNAPQIINILSKIITLCLPFIIGIIFAYMLNPLVNLIERKFKISRALSIAISYIGIVSFIIFLGIFILPKLYKSFLDLINELPNDIMYLQNMFNDLLGNKEFNSIIQSIGVNEKDISNLIVTTMSNMGSLLNGSFIFIKSVSTWTVNIVFGFFISIYVLIDKDRFKIESKKIIYIIFKKEKSEKIIEFLRLYRKMINTYIGIKAIDSMIIGSLAFIILHIAGSKYATILALIVGVTNMIPYFGPLIGEIIGFLLNLFISPTKAVIIFLCLFSLQMFDGWYLDPKLVGNKVGVRPFFIILAVMIGGGLFGVVGMLLASPTMAVIKHYYTKWIIKNSEIIKQIEG